MHISFRQAERWLNPSDPEPERHKHLPWSDIGSGPWWQIISDLTLPPLSPDLELYNVSGQPERVNGTYPREGAYAQPELHYRRQDFARVPEFDVDQTYEHLYGLNEYQHLIVSNRFYKFSHENRLPWKFLPVHVDP